MALWFLAFFVGAIVSLATSWLLVTRLERIGERLGLSEALLGVIAALAADAPEITSAISAMAQHRKTIGAGVVIGSNVFNLAALLGLGALVAGFITLHRRVVVLGGTAAMFIAACCTLATFGYLSADAALILCSILFVPFIFVAGIRREKLVGSRVARRLTRWIAIALDDEEVELFEAIRPRRGRSVDVVIAGGSLLVVVASSIAMERGASTIGRHFRISDAIVGGLILAAVTSLPNAVAAVHLASKGRGAAALSTALNSNNLNVLAGLLVPGAIVGLSVPTFAGELTALSYFVLTALVLICAFMYRGLNRRAGWYIISGYAIFVVWLTLTSK